LHLKTKKFRSALGLGIEEQGKTQRTELDGGGASLCNVCGRLAVDSTPRSIIARQARPKRVRISAWPPLLPHWTRRRVRLTCDARPVCSARRPRIALKLAVVGIVPAHSAVGRSAASVCARFAPALAEKLPDLAVCLGECRCARRPDCSRGGRRRGRWCRSGRRCTGVIRSRVVRLQQPPGRVS